MLLQPKKTIKRNKPFIRLYEAVGTGLIIDYPSGIIFSNQTMGYSCWQPEQEGIYVPVFNELANDHKLMSPEIALMKYFKGPLHKGTGAPNGISREDADFIDKLITSQYGGDKLIVDRERLDVSHEAWIYMHMKGDVQEDLICGFAPYPRTAILTWCNSD